MQIRRAVFYAIAADRNSGAAGSRRSDARQDRIREKVHYLGRVVAPDKEGAIDRAMKEFRIERARRFSLIVVSLE